MLFLINNRDACYVPAINIEQDLNSVSPVDPATTTPKATIDDNFKPLFSGTYFLHAFRIFTSLLRAK